MSRVFEESSSSLASGMHRYAGDISKLRLRLTFTDNELLVTRPSLLVSGKVDGDGDGDGERDRESIWAKQTVKDEFSSSFLIEFVDDEWTIREEKKSLLFERSGLRLNIIRAGRDNIPCSQIDINRDDVFLEKGAQQSGLTSEAGNGSGSNKELRSRDETIGTYMTTSERAFNWKDTSTVTSDNNNWQRKLARKLPYKMRNSCLPDYQHSYHDCLVTTAAAAALATDRDRQMNGNLSCGSCVASQQDCGKAIERSEESCKLLADQYRDWLLLNKERDVPLSERSKRLGKLVCSSSSLERPITIGAERSAPVTPTRSSARSEVGKEKLLGELNKRRKEGEVESEVESAVFLSVVDNEPKREATRSRCSHGEILYIIMEKHELSGGESLPVCLSTTSHTAAATGATVSVASGDNKTGDNSVGPDGLPAVDATVSTGQSSRQVDKRLTIERRDSKVQELHQQQESEKNHPSDRTWQADNDDDDEHKEEDKLGNKGLMVSEISLNYSQLDQIAADQIIKYGESSDKASERQIKLTASERWMQQEHLRLARFSSRDHYDDSKVLCLALIRIDVLNRFILLKPDLNELISLNICTEFGFCGAYSAAVAATTTTTTTTTTATAASVKANIGDNRRARDISEEEPNQLGGERCFSEMTPAHVAQIDPRSSSSFIFYQLQLVLPTNNSTGRSEEEEAERQVNLLFNKLLPKLPSPPSRDQSATSFSYYLTESRRSKTTSKCTKAVKLQFQLDYGSQFPSHCKNLYVKYKLFTRNKSSNSWRLKAHKMKDDTESVASESCCNNQRKLAQMTHSLFSSPFAHLSSTTSQGACQQGEEILVSETSQQQAKIQSNSGEQKQHHVINDDDDDDGDDSEQTGETCLLEGSTVTSQPNSEGRFHFACTEEIMLEVVRLDDIRLTDKRRLQQTPRRRLRPRQQQQQHLDETHPLLSRAFASSLSLQQQKSFESKSNNLIDNRKLDELTTHPSTTPAASPSPPYSAASQTPNQPEVSKQTDMMTTINEQASSHSLASRSSTDSDNKNNNPEIDNHLLLIRVTDCPLDGAHHYEGQLKSNSTSRHESGKTLDSEDNEEFLHENQVIELVLLFEFYSSDFYRDKPQGWSHLSVPIYLGESNLNNNPCASINNNAQHQGNQSRFTSIELSVIRPELCSFLDKLRYYLIGQLPASMTTIDSFSRSNQRYLIRTRQSGTMRLNFEVLRQTSDLNTSRHIPMTKGESRKSYQKSLSLSNKLNVKIE